MTIARPGRATSRFPRALATLFALALTLALSGRVAPPAVAASGLLGPPELGLHWQTIPAVPCAGESLAVLLTMCECPYDLVDVVYDRPTPTVRITGDPDRVCVTCTPDSVLVKFPGTYQAGIAAFSFYLETEFAPDSLVTLSTWIEVPIAPSCTTPSGIPYLDRVIIGQPAPCEGCPSRACPNDSIDVFLAGTFPDDCTHLEDVALYPSMTMGPMPQPPIVRITYGTASCLGRPCVMQPQPWAARVRLPALPTAPQYMLPVEAYLHDICTPDSVGQFLAGAAFPFSVADSCTTSVPPPPPLDRCFNVAWLQLRSVEVSDPYVSRCTAEWRPGGTTQLALAVGSQAPIAGVQGALRLENAGALRIVDIGALLPGWEVARSRAPDGSDRFIAFAGPGAAPIPGSIDGRPRPFLRVVVEHNALLDVVTPDVVHLAALDLLVSDVNGIGVPGCPTPAIYPGPNVATLCRLARCDANADGHSDVRDLVVMVNCLYPPPNVRLACPDSASGVLDCDRSGDFDLDDVFCCARSMLGGGTPPDSTGGMREAPEIVARFGVPQAAGDGVLEVPLFLGGMAGVAAARLEIAYPDARYELLDVTFAGTPTSWWTLHEESGGRSRLAIIDLSGLGGVAEPLDAPLADPRAILRLRLRAGATPGGELSVTAHDFAAGDGVGLTTPNAAPRLALAADGTSGIALSAARPNPFTGSTAFALTVPTAGTIDVAVFAASGRRVATLLRESAAAAGVYDLAWDGRQDAGGRAPAGVYFVRVVGGAADASRKVLYLPGAAR